jgi:hypothetical protein
VQEDLVVLKGDLRRRDGKEIRYLRKTGGARQGWQECCMQGDLVVLKGNLWGEWWAEQRGGSSA